MQVINIERKFKYNSVSLPDPNPALSPDQVREFYATQYPELNNAVVEGPETKAQVATWTFTRAAGAKGAGREAPAQSAVDVVRNARETKGSSHAEALSQAARQAGHGRAGALIAQVTQRRSAQEVPLHMPTAAYGIWG